MRAQLMASVFVLGLAGCDDWLTSEVDKADDLASARAEQFAKERAEKNERAERRRRWRLAQQEQPSPPPTEEPTPPPAEEPTEPPAPPPAEEPTPPAPPPVEEPPVEEPTPPPVEETPPVEEPTPPPVEPPVETPPVEEPIPPVEEPPVEEPEPEEPPVEEPTQPPVEEPTPPPPPPVETGPVAARLTANDYIWGDNGEWAFELQGPTSSTIDFVSIKFGADTLNAGESLQLVLYNDYFQGRPFYQQTFTGHDQTQVTYTAEGVFGPHGGSLSLELLSGSSVVIESVTVGRSANGERFTAPVPLINLTPVPSM